MNTFEIIKKAFLLPFRAYKGFALTTFLFFISEIVKEMVLQINFGDLAPLLVVLVFISGTLSLGISIAVVYHYIYDSFDIREVSFTTTAKAGFKDTFIEFYYYFLAIISTMAISYILGIYKNIYSIIPNVIYAEEKFQSLTLPNVLKLLSPDTYHQLASSVILTLSIFIVMFALFFSYCSFAKIRLKETGGMKESVNIINLTKIIKDKGIKKYLTFVVLNFIVFMTVLIIMRTLESYFFVGSVISALTESFALFFILDSYCLFYYS